MFFERNQKNIPAVPEVDIHNTVRDFDILLFGSFTQPV